MCKLNFRILTITLCVIIAYCFHPDFEGNPDFAALMGKKIMKFGYCVLYKPEFNELFKSNYYEIKDHRISHTLGGVTEFKNLAFRFKKELTSAGKGFMFKNGTKTVKYTFDIKMRHATVSVSVKTSDKSLPRKDYFQLEVHYAPMVIQVNVYGRRIKGENKFSEMFCAISPEYTYTAGYDDFKYPSDFKESKSTEKAENKILNLLKTRLVDEMSYVCGKLVNSRVFGGDCINHQLRALQLFLEVIGNVKSLK